MGQGANSWIIWTESSISSDPGNRVRWNWLYHVAPVGEKPALWWSLTVSTTILFSFDNSQWLLSITEWKFSEPLIESWKFLQTRNHGSNRSTWRTLVKELFFFFLPVAEKSLECDVGEKNFIWNIFVTSIPPFTTTYEAVWKSSLLARTLSNELITSTCVSRVMHSRVQRNLPCRVKVLSFAP